MTTKVVKIREEYSHLNQELIEHLFNKITSLEQQWIRNKKTDEKTCKSELQKTIARAVEGSQNSLLK